MAYPIRPKRPRTLRSYKSLAHQEHGPCCQCHRPICAGDEYEAFVKVFGRRLWTEKYHVYCPVDFWEEQDELIRELEKTPPEKPAAPLAQAA